MQHYTISEHQTSHGNKSNQIKSHLRSVHAKHTVQNKTSSKKAGTTPLGRYFMQVLVTGILHVFFCE